MQDCICSLVFSKALLEHSSLNRSIKILLHAANINSIQFIAAINLERSLKLFLAKKSLSLAEQLP